MAEQNLKTRRVAHLEPTGKRTKENFFFCPLTVSLSKNSLDAVNDVFDDSPDFQIVGIVEFDRLKLFVLGTEFDFAVANEKAFNHELAVDAGDHDVAVFGADASVDNH